MAGPGQLNTNDIIILTNKTGRKGQLVLLPEQATDMAQKFEAGAWVGFSQSNVDVYQKVTRLGMICHGANLLRRGELK